MTKEDFIKPYLLLVFQPWGRRYDLATPEGQTQSEFYYHAISWAHPDAWMKVAQQQATGEQWPSLTAIKLALNAINGDFVTALPGPKVHYLTLEEFGLDLYECIKLCAMRDQLRQQYRKLVTNLSVLPPDRKKALDALKAREGALTEEIAALMPKIGQDDAARLFRQYDAVAR